MQLPHHKKTELSKKMGKLLKKYSVLYLGMVDHEENESETYIFKLTNM